MPSSWGREHLVWDVIHTAGRCQITPAELDDRAVLRYGKFFRELDNDQLLDELNVLRALADSLFAFPINRPFQSPKNDDRTADEQQWDSEVL